jgi:hypothetical protein
MIYRRRRAAQANLAYTRQTGGNQFGGPSPFPPQYPPNAYNGSPYAYDPATGFAPVRTSDYLSPRTVLTPESVLLALRLAAAVRASTRRASNHIQLQGWCDGLKKSESRIMSSSGFGRGSLCHLVIFFVCNYYKNCCIMCGSCTLPRYLQWISRERCYYILDMGHCARTIAAQCTILAWFGHRVAIESSE